MTAITIEIDENNDFHLEVYEPLMKNDLLLIIQAISELETLD